MWDTGGLVEPGVHWSVAAVAAPEWGKSAPVGMALVGDELHLVPDRKLLTDPNTIFPVVIDPAWAHKVKDYWYMVWSNGLHFNNSPTENARVGFDGWSDNKRSRVYYRFDTAPWRGREVMSATFGHRQVHSPNWTCRLGSYGPGVELWFTGAISSSMTWSNQAPWLERIATSGLAAGHSQACPWSEQEWDATGLVARTAHYPDITLGLRSADENNRDGWRQYSHTGGLGYPFLRVRYNSAPVTPGMPQVVRNPMVDGGFLTGPDVSLSAPVSDPDGDLVRGRFWVRRPLLKGNFP